MNTKRFASFIIGELRATAKDGGHVIEGLACPYETWSEPIYGMFMEQFARGAFRDHLKSEPDVIATINHNPQFLTGRSSSGTLELVDKNDGVHIRNKLPNTTYVKDLIENIERKDIRGMSFIFDCKREDETWLHDGVDMPQRTINKAKILEVTYTPIPAYKDTSLALRSMNLADDTHFREMMTQNKPQQRQAMKTADAIAKLNKLGIKI